MERAMPTQAQVEPKDLPVLRPSQWLGRLLSGFAILFLLFDVAMKLVPLPVVTETMDRIGYGSSKTLARALGAITMICTILYAVPPTSFVGAILVTGYLGGAIASHLRIDSPLFTHNLFGLYFGLMVWGGLWLRDPKLRQLLPFRSDLVRVILFAPCTEGPHFGGTLLRTSSLGNQCNPRSRPCK
jgi:hypothetical protein